jgi:26S proteasome regulatory subunit N12
MKDNVPAKSYSFFMTKMLHTIRDEIASCMEKAYEHISLKECAKMLQLDAKDCNKLIKERNWTVSGTGAKAIVTFAAQTSAIEDKSKMHDEVPTQQLAKMSITYAREMEQIV